MRIWPGSWSSSAAIAAAIVGLLLGPNSPQAQGAGIGLPQQDAALFQASCQPPHELLARTFYHVCYDPEARIPVWVGYDLTPALLAGSTKRTDDFRPDLEIAPDRRAELRDYLNSGFDRGHMAPAEAFKRSRPAMSHSFLLSNMAPQTAKLNRGRWARLEQEVRELAREGERTIVISGSLFLDQGRPTTPSRRIDRRVAVPTDCFTAILQQGRGGRLSALGFVLPNIRGPIPGPSARYVRSIDQIEALLGADLFAFLDDDVEADIEANFVVPDVFE